MTTQTPYIILSNQGLRQFEIDNQYIMPIGELAQLARNYTSLTLEVEPSKFKMTEYQRGIIPGVIGLLVGTLGIEKVSERYTMGRVFSFDVFPVKISDPVIIVCPLVDLSRYYKIWSRLVRANSHDVLECIGEYDASILSFIRSARCLNKDEIIFGVGEMLNFRNAMLSRAGQWR